MSAPVDQTAGGLLVVSPLERAAPDQLGGKGVRLSELTKQGIPVPSWIALTADAAEMVLAPLRDRIDAITRAVPSGDLEAARRASASIAQLVREADWPDSLGRQLYEGLGRLQLRRRLAVRSSAVGEDGAEHSYAGQLGTLLCVPPDGVEAAVRECWGAAYSARAILYRLARGMSDAPVRIAVLIQEMVEARVSGIAFTADPVTGVPAHVIVAGYGLGEGVVSDQVESDHFLRGFDSLGWRSTVRRKTRRIVPRGGEPGTEIAEVPAEDRDRPALTEAQLERLSAVLSQIEEHAGRPQDVEWAFDGEGGLWVLQARPISSLPEGELAIWDDSNVGESYPGLTLPLTCSYVRFVYERLFRHALVDIGVSGGDVARARPALAHLVGVVRGRLYFNLLHYYRLFSLVPGLEGAVRKWETAFGVTRHFDIARLRDGRQRRRALARLLTARTGLRLAWRLLRLGADVRRFHERVEEMMRRFRDADFSMRPVDDLLQIYERINAEFLDCWTLLIFNDLFVVRFADRLARLCGGAGGERGTEFQHRLVSGLVGVDSVALIRSVLELVEAARAEPAVEALLRSTRSAREVWAEIGACEAAAAFRAMAEAHLRRHGQRTIEELKFETTPLSDTPWELVAIVRNYLDLDARLEDLDEEQCRIRQAAEREFRALFRGNPWKRVYASWVLERTRRCIADRENMSYARCRAYGVLRRLFRAMGEALVKAAGLRVAEDVFYLTLEDLEAYVRGALPESDLTGLVELRRARYAEFAREEPPHRIVCRGPVYSCARQEESSVAGETLRGVPCAPGVVQGVARVLRSPSPDDRVNGEILVAPVTEPGWAFLMFAAKGLIVERGSVLSHTAIIGRELGIPTIVGAEGATTWVSSGDEIEMDGGTGEIRMLRRRADSPRPRASEAALQ